MRENFAVAVGFVLKHEGGYVDDLSDPGGETNFGIAKRYHPDVDIKNLDAHGAAEIYLKEYWLPTCDILAFPKDIVFMDMAVNMGKGTATNILSLSATWEEMLMRRVRYYTDKVIENPIKIKFFFGWIGRVLALKTFIQTEFKNKKQ